MVSFDLSWEGDLSNVQNHLPWSSQEHIDSLMDYELLHRKRNKIKSEQVKSNIMARKISPHNIQQMLKYMTQRWNRNTRNKKISRFRFSLKTMKTWEDYGIF